MVLPEPFTTASPVSVNFSFSEVIEGTGSIVFYAGSALADAAVEKEIISSHLFYSNAIEVIEIEATLAAGFVLIREENYNLSSIIIPQTVTGNAQVSISWGVFGHASSTIGGLIKARLIKVDGGGETIIATGQSDVISKAGASWETKDTTLLLELIETHFNKGDIIRLSIEGYLNSSVPPNGGRIVWGQDPRNRDGTVLTAGGGNRTDTNIIVPFETNL